MIRRMDGWIDKKNERDLKRRRAKFEMYNFDQLDFHIAFDILLCVLIHQVILLLLSQYLAMIRKDKG